MQSPTVQTEAYYDRLQIRDMSNILSGFQASCLSETGRKAYHKSDLKEILNLNLSYIS